MMRTRKLCFTLGCLLAMLLASSVTYGQDHLLSQPVRLNAWNKTVPNVLAQLTDQVKIDIIVDPSFMKPAEFANQRLFLHTDRIPLRQALEFLCLSLDCRYRIEAPGSIVLTGGYSWLQKMPATIKFHSVSSLIGPNGDVTQFERILGELLRVHSLFREYSMRIEAPDMKCIAILPEPLQARLQTALTLMSRRGEPIPSAASIRMNAEEASLLERLHHTIVANYRQQPLEAIVRDISLQSGLHIGLQPPNNTLSTKTLTLDLGSITTRGAIEALAKHLSLSGIESMPPRGIWLDATNARWTPLVSQELLWDPLPMRAFHAAHIAKHLGGGEVLAHHLRRRVTPAIWADPSAAVVYHPHSGNLIVLAPASTQDSIIAELSRLQEQATQTDKRNAAGDTP